jgi:hypothetical protein
MALKLRRYVARARVGATCLVRAQQIVLSPSSSPSPPLSPSSLPLSFCFVLFCFVVFCFININVQPPAFRRHLEELSKQYNRVVAINLIDQKGSELLLANAFEREAKKHAELKYVFFNYLYYFLFLIFILYLDTLLSISTINAATCGMIACPC